MAHPPSTEARPRGRALPRSTRAAWLRVAVLMTAPLGLVCGGATSSLLGTAKGSDGAQALLARDGCRSP